MLTVKAYKRRAITTIVAGSLIAGLTVGDFLKFRDTGVSWIHPVLDLFIVLAALLMVVLGIMAICNGRRAKKAGGGVK